MNVIPQYLYRGITVDYDHLQYLKLSGVDISPHYAPIIDEFGRETVSDGNEYGVYMSDNYHMVQKAYARVDSRNGTLIRKDLMLKINSVPSFLRIPAVGVIYKIDTNGIGAHKPWISSKLKAVYNNGYQGDEYIALSIPSNNYSVIELNISEDLLHEAQTIDVANIQVAEAEVKQIVESRKGRLELLAKFLEKLTPQKRAMLRSEDILLFKDIFGENGIHYTETEDIKLDTVNDYVRYVLSSFYKKDMEEVDLSTLRYIESLKIRLDNSASMDNLFTIIQEDIDLNNLRKSVFIQRKLQSGEVAITTGFYEKENIYRSVLDVAKKKWQQQTTLDYQQGDDATQREAELDMMFDALDEIDTVDQNLSGGKKGGF